MDIRRSNVSFLIVSDKYILHSLVNVYPNPTTGKITITSGKNLFEADSVFSLTDYTGKNVYQSILKSESDKMEIDLNDLSSKLIGNYFITVPGKSEMSFKKIVKF